MLLFHSVDCPATLDSPGCFWLPMCFGVRLTSPAGYFLYPVSSSVTTGENLAVFWRGEGPAVYHILAVLYGPASRMTAWDNLQNGKSGAWSPPVCRDLVMEQ